MIVGIRLLREQCCKCEERADYEVERTNDELKGKTKDGIPYYTEGTRGLYYCANHVPQDVRDYWNDQIPDMPDQQI